MKNGKMMIRSSYMMAGGIIFLFALIFSTACSNPVLPFMADRIVNGGGKTGPVVFTLGGNIPSNTITQGSFVVNGDWCALWVDGPTKTGDIYEWYVSNDNGTTWKGPIAPNGTDDNNNWKGWTDSWLGVQRLGKQFDGPFTGGAPDLDGYKYLAAGAYQIYCVVSRNGKVIGQSDTITVTVNALTYDIEITDGNGSPVTQITVTQGQTVNQTLHIQDTVKDTYFKRDYSWSVTIGGNTISDSTSMWAWGAAYGATTLTFNQTIPADLLPGDYTVTFTGNASNSGFSAATKTITLKVEGIAEIEAGPIDTTTTPSTSLWVAVNGSYPITQGSFTVDNDGTDENYALSFDSTNFSSGETYEWYVVVGDDTYLITDAEADTIGLLYIEYNDTPIVSYTYDETSTNPVYLPAGTYLFYAEISDDQGELIGTTDVVTVTVEALDYAITVTDDDNNDAVVADGATIEVEDGDIATFVLNLTVQDNAYDDTTILTRSYTWTVSDGTDTDDNSATPVAGSGNNGEGTISIDFASDFTNITIGTPQAGDEYTVTIEATAENDGLDPAATKTITFTILVVAP